MSLINLLLVCKALWILFLLLLLIEPIMMFFVGLRCLRDCPLEPKIPVYLVIGGGFGIVKVMQLLFFFWNKNRKELNSNDDLYSTTATNSGKTSSISQSKFEELFTHLIIGVFLFVWFIFGNYWTFKIWKPNFKQPLYDVTNWCSQEVYVLSLINLATYYCLIICALFTSCIWYCAKIYKKKKYLDDYSSEINEFK